MSQNPHMALIDALIATYRTLNMEVRPKPEAELRSRGGGHGVRDIVQSMRNDELLFSQALKERISGVTMPEIFQDELPVIGTEHEGDSTAKLLAQFGTARESTLAMLRSLAAEEWEAASGTQQPITARVAGLVANDRKQLERIAQVVPTVEPAATVSAAAN